MRKLLLTSLMAAGLFISIQAQSLIEVTSDISTNTTWTKNNQYLLKGNIKVTAGATLTIEPGTIIKGDKVSKGTLIIMRDAFINAKGTAQSPIVFTSNQAKGKRGYGDWAGVIICGNAPVNTLNGIADVEGGVGVQYGGTNPADSSGVLSYVRIEYSGIAKTTNDEVNGLTLCGVGSKTQIDHIQVSFNGDDSFEWFGGTVNAKYLISHSTLDDDFDTDFGFSGNIQYGVSLRAPFVNDVSGSRCFESDSYKAGSTVDGLSDNTKLTRPVFSNMTIVGPIATPTSTFYQASQFGPAVHIRKGSSLSMFNSVVMGWPAGIIIDETPGNTVGSTVGNIQEGTLQIKNNIVAGIKPGGTGANAPSRRELIYVISGVSTFLNQNTYTTTEGTDTTTAAVAKPFSATAVQPFGSYAGPFSWFAANNNQILATSDEVKLTDPFNTAAPNFMPEVNSPVLTGADFTSAKISDNFFDKTTFRGAFGTEDWMAGWTEFDPNNREYKIGDATGTGGVTSIFNPTSTSTMVASVAPNPTAGSMKITYVLDNSSDVTISIYDLAGNKVGNVFAGFAANGENSVNFDGSSLVKGLYLIKISTNNSVKTIRVTVN